MDGFKAWVEKNRTAAIGLAVLGVLGMVFLWKQFARSTNPYDYDTLTEIVTIRDKETGEEWEMPRGRMEQLLWDRPLPINPEEGIENPKTGKKTGFPISQWEETIKRIHRDREGMQGHSPSSTEATPKGGR